MNTQLLGDFEEQTGGATRDRAAGCSITQEQLLNLGVHQVAYLRAEYRQGVPVFMVHRADGAPLATVEDLQDAVELADGLGFDFVTVH